MSTTTLVQSSTITTAPYESIHIVCSCDFDVALCGADVSGRPLRDMKPHPNDCLICLDLQPMPCPRCKDGRA